MELVLHRRADPGLACNNGIADILFVVYRIGLQHCVKDCSLHPLGPAPTMQLLTLLLKARTYAHVIDASK